MAPRSVRPRLDDILTAIEAVKEIAAALDFDSYCRSKLHLPAVERYIEIISEASRHLPESLTNRHPEIPWRDIRGIGNHIGHAYSDVDDELIWKVAKVFLPELKPAIVALIAFLETVQGSKD